MNAIPSAFGDIISPVSDVIIVMRHLKNKKSRDPYGYANEIREVHKVNFRTTNSYQGKVAGFTMVFCYIVCINSKTFLVVSPRFWVVWALERLPTWKFDL